MFVHIIGDILVRDPLIAQTSLAAEDDRLCFRGAIRAIVLVADRQIDRRAAFGAHRLGDESLSKVRWIPRVAVNIDNHREPSSSRTWVNRSNRRSTSAVVSRSITYPDRKS